MKYTMYSKKGVSTILGTLIFIGILFSAYAPMMLTMRQADSYYEQQKHQVSLLDDERSREDLTFYVYPDLSDNLIVSVENSGPTSLKVVRVWINNKIQEESTWIQSLDSSLFGPYVVNPTEGDSFNIRVTTERGNVYEADSGEIKYGPVGWEIESKIINVLISAPGTIFHIYIYKWENEVWELKDDGQVQKIGGTAYKPFEISAFQNGEFRVKITRGSSIIHDEDGLMMEWPEGPSSLWVYA